MMNKLIIKLSLSFFVITAMAACAASHYHVVSAERTVILIDSTFDAAPDEVAAAFIEPYSQVVDSVMRPVVGHSARYMAARRPESALSNLLADILVWAASGYDEKPVMGVYNVGGIRAALPEGAVTYGDVLEIAPFENKICFLTLAGKDLLLLFENIAAAGGEGVSSGVELVITRDGRLAGARLHGKEIDPEADYRIATIDYLAEGNDKMDDFLSKKDFNSPQAATNDTRYIISDYFRAKEKEGVVVDAKIEGRITIK